MTTQPIVRLVALSKSYIDASGRTVVLQDVDLAIEAGEKVSLVGPSGSGKSTLLSLIAGLLAPDTGRVQINGLALDDLDDAQRAEIRAETVGIALQSDNLIPFLTAHENIELALSFTRSREATKRTDSLLDQMGLSHRRHHLPRQLSGGEAQRISLAVAMANRPALLLADEMVAQLDEATAAQVVDEIFDSSMAVLFVTHDVKLADRADRRLRMVDHDVVLR